MTSIQTLSFCMLTMLALSFHAKAEIEDQDKIATGSITKPDHIWVYDFSATSSDIPSESALAGHTTESESFQTEQDVAAGRKLGAKIAAELVNDLQTMGLSVARANSETEVALNDVVIRGHLISSEEGGQEKRVLIGFGTGESELKAAAEGFQMRSDGLRRLGSATIDASEGFAGKTPGVAVGVVGTIATHNPLGLIVSTGVKSHLELSGEGKLEERAKDTGQEIANMLKPRFQEFGWIE